MTKGFIKRKARVIKHNLITGGEYKGKQVNTSFPLFKLLVRMNPV